MAIQEPQASFKGLNNINKLIRQYISQPFDKKAIYCSISQENLYYINITT